MGNFIIKPSYYNILIEKDDGLAVYNTATGKMIRCYENSDNVRNLLDLETLYYSEDNTNIVELYSRGILINADRNEILEMEEKEKNSEYSKYMQLILLPTEQCNFRCVYCYEKFERGKMSSKIQDAIVDYVENNIDAFPGLNIIWFGGEPTIALDVMESLSMRLIEVCKRKKKIYNAGITTNGYALTLDTLRKLKKMHVTEYQVTLDGLPFIHDKQRVLKNGSETFKKIMENLTNIKENIKSCAITFLIRTNFSKEMMNYIDEFCEILDENFGDDKRFKYYWQMVADYGYVRDENVRNIFGEIKDYKWLIDNYTDRMLNNYTRVLYGPDGGVCYALKRNSMLIDSEGSIRKCTCDLGEEVNYFGVIGKTFERSKHEEWMNVRRITEKSSCYLCKKRPICHNRACYKAKGCLPNYVYLDKVLYQMTEDTSYYEVIGGGRSSE